MFRPRDLAEWHYLINWLYRIHQVRRSYRSHMGSSLHLLRPQRFTEKMQWRKLFDLNPLYAIFNDKLAVRDYIAAHLGVEVLPQLLWVGDESDAVPLAAFDRPYIVKPTHSCGFSLKVGCADEVDSIAAHQTFAQWLRTDYGTPFEPAYGPVPRRIIVERMLVGPDGNPPLERRFFVFDGRVRLIITNLIENGKMVHGACHDQHWNELMWHGKRGPRHVPRPKQLETLVDQAERLGREVDHVRVDTYDLGDRVYIGELTVYSWSGLTFFKNPVDADFILGSYWRIQRPALRAIATMLAGPHGIVDAGDVAKLRRRFAASAARVGI